MTTSRTGAVGRASSHPPSLTTGQTATGRGGGWRGRRSRQAVADLIAMPLRRAPHLPLLPRIWELRQNVTFYDAAYLALAEALEVALLTADERLARAPGRRCEVEVVIS